MKIQVTQEDIKNGRKWKSFFCPIALAISRELEKEDLVSIGSAGSWSINGERQQKFPKFVEDWIRSFDKGETVDPFEFTISDKNYDA